MIRKATKDDKLDFGHYVYIEQKRFGCDNEMYQYKVIRRLESNRYRSVPVFHENKEQLNDKIETVLACICCGIVEETVEYFKIEDVYINEKVV